jgi:hypothetical protein
MRLDKSNSLSVCQMIAISISVLLLCLCHEHRLGESWFGDLVSSKGRKAQSPIGPLRYWARSLCRRPAPVLEESELRAHLPALMGRLGPWSSNSLILWAVPKKRKKSMISSLLLQTNASKRGCRWTLSLSRGKHKESAIESRSRGCHLQSR